MGFLDIVGLKYNLGIAYVNILNDGRFNSSMWVLPKFVLVYGFIMQVLYLMYIRTIGLLYHDMGIVMGIPIHNVDFKGAMYYCILGFCSMMNVYRIINYMGAGILSYFLQSWEGFQSPIPFMSKTPPSPLSQTRTWCGGLQYAMDGKIK
jgi:hypothetical protein